MVRSETRPGWAAPVSTAVRAAVERRKTRQSERTVQRNIVGTPEMAGEINQSTPNPGNAQRREGVDFKRVRKYIQTRISEIHEHTLLTAM
jgi:hypothetical protein